MRIHVHTQTRTHARTHAREHMHTGDLESSFAHFSHLLPLALQIPLYTKQHCPSPDAKQMVAKSSCSSVKVTLGR